MKKLKKRALTLIEIMIVMFLIMMILGVVAYNLRGAFDEGKAFKTRANIDRLQSMLEFAVAKDPQLLEEIETHWVDIIKSDPLTKDADQLVRDGWGYEYDVEVENGNIVVSSKQYDEYRKTHATKF